MAALTEEIVAIYSHVGDKGEKWLATADAVTILAYVRRIIRNYDKEGLTAKTRFIARVRSWAKMKQIDDVLRHCPAG